MSTHEIRTTAPGTHRRTGADVPSPSFLRALDPRPLPGVPGEVQTAFALWLTAIGAGVLETAIMVGVMLADGAAFADVLPNIAIRLAIYTALTVLVSRVRLANWARIAVTVLLGGVGTLSLVFEPISWLAAGNSVPALLADAGIVFFVIVVVRVVHISAVFGALFSMYRPAANRYYRSRNR